MAISNATRDSITALQKELAVFGTRLSSTDAELTSHNIALMRERLAKLEARTDELLKRHETAGNRLFQIGVAILTAQFALIVTVIAALIRK